MFKLIVLFSLAISVVSSKSLPSFIKQCPKNDHVCALASAMAASSDIFKGYEPFGIEPTNPFSFDYLDMSTGANIQLFLKNGVATLPSFNLETVNVDADAKQWTIKAVLDVSMDSEYSVHGKLMIMPIEGNGTCHIDMEKVIIDYIINLNEVTHDDDGAIYYEMADDSITVKMARMRYDYRNLFNGNTELGDNVNQFINKHWKVVEHEFHDGIVTLLLRMVRQIMLPIFANVPKDEIISS